MPLFPEREKKPDLEFRPEDASPLDIERKEVVTPVPSQFTKQIKTDDGQVLTQPQPPTTVTVTLPVDQAQLAGPSKGSADDSVTWFTVFWLRMIKKAIHFGWRIIGKNPNI
ncbi:MAG: hypothetical protein Q8P91_03645 [bacterium]|nr:hypothetical protein [bacterium]